METSKQSIIFIPGSFIWKFHSLKVGAMKKYHSVWYKEQVDVSVTESTA